MKHFLFLALILICLKAPAQRMLAKPSANKVLEQVHQNLASLSSVSYSYVREMKYHADNYHSMDSAFMYIEFRNELTGGLRFQARRLATRFVYNGYQILNLSETGKTIDTSSVRSVRHLEGYSYLFHSLAMLRRAIPAIIANEQIVKSLGDTVVAGKPCYTVRMEGAGLYFQGFGAILPFDDSTLRRPYYLVVDKKSLFPVTFIAKLVRGADDRDFINVSYAAIRRNPPAPPAQSWSYATYQPDYKPFVPEPVIPVIKPDARVPAFKLPSYVRSGTDSISSASLEGKVVLLEFWFKSCSPCMRAMPHYNGLQQKYADRGFQLITINVEDPVEDIAFFYNKYQPVYPMLYNGNALFKQLGFTGCPSSLLVDRKGKAAKTFSGYDEKEIEAGIESLLAIP